jgi:hypothetical protein
MMDAQQAAELRRPFPASAIGQLPKGGTMLDYVGHAATTDRLLAVDPEWTWEPLATDDQGLPAIDKAGNLWIRLTVCGVTRIGVGDGLSMKERIGDAIRNAAMRFGVALDLWAKEDLHEIQQGLLAPDTAPKESDPLLTAKNTVHAAWLSRHQRFNRDEMRADFEQWASVPLDDADAEVLMQYAKHIKEEGSDATPDGA